MATPQEKLANALEHLKSLQDKGVLAFRHADFSRIDREILMKHNFLEEVLRGWYIATPNDRKKGDSTAWFTSFWGFTAQYLSHRFGENYCLSVEQSLSIHVGNETIPHQLIIRCSEEVNGLVTLPYGTSLFVMHSAKASELPLDTYQGLRLIDFHYALVHCSPSVYVQRPTEMRTALLMISDVSELLRILLDGGHSIIAGRLVGAFRNVKRDKEADSILKTMTSAGYSIRESDPFEQETPQLLTHRIVSPYVHRIQLMWNAMRPAIIELFPKEPGIPTDHSRYLQQIEDLYTTDAYHSLSIERYQVTPELIELVRSGKWDAKSSSYEKQQRDAMAARGYYQAFQEVKKSVELILKGENAGKVLNDHHGDWYRELFAPSVTAGILKPSDLAGYRVNQVYIGQSKHTPLNKDAVRDTMPILFELLSQETHAGVRAVLGHFFFVYIHPYMDGNGRIGRFILNAMLCSGGYPWTVIPVEYRDEYMQALESASVEQNIVPFAEFISKLVQKGLENDPVAKI
jgi:hypothetical protein